LFVSQHGECSRLGAGKDFGRLDPKGLDERATAIYKRSTEFVCTVSNYSNRDPRNSMSRALHIGGKHPIHRTKHDLRVVGRREYEFS
jgi:hypothetical protein